METTRSTAHKQNNAPSGKAIRTHSQCFRCKKAWKGRINDLYKTLQPFFFIARLITWFNVKRFSCNAEGYRTGSVTLLLYAQAKGSVTNPCINCSLFNKANKKKTLTGLQPMCQSLLCSRRQAFFTPGIAVRAPRHKRPAAWKITAWWHWRCRHTVTQGSLSRATWLTTKKGKEEVRGLRSKWVFSKDYQIQNETLQ